jgi:AcrR family transcriptional regulator
MNKSDALKRAILQAAIMLAKQEGFRNISRAAIAKRAGSAEATVSYHFGTMDEMRTAIMAAAIEQEIPEIVAQGLAARYVPARKAPEALKRKAVRVLAA